MNQDICSLLILILLILYVVFEKFILPKIGGETLETAEYIVDSAEELAAKIGIVCSMAEKFVALAKVTFEGEGRGEEKQNWVVEHLSRICDSIDLILTKDELRAINEDAYNKMKKESE